MNSVIVPDYLDGELMTMDRDLETGLGGKPIPGSISPMLNINTQKQIPSERGLSYFFNYSPPLISFLTLNLSLTNKV